MIKVEQEFIETLKTCPVCGAVLPRAQANEVYEYEIHSIVRCETEGCNHKRVVNRFARYRKPEPPVARTIFIRDGFDDTWFMVGRPVLFYLRSA